MRCVQPWRIHFLIPGLIVLSFLCDVSARWVRLDSLSFRGDEAMVQFRPRGQLGPFEPNRRYHNRQSSGDLPNLSNQQEYRVFRDQVFTTNDLGFRDSIHINKKEYKIITMGSSFVMGSGCSDGQTLPSRIEAISGCKTYNAGGVDTNFETILNLSKKLKISDGLIVIECLERYIGNPVQIQKENRVRKSRWAWFPYREQLIALYLAGNEFLEISPLEIILKIKYKKLQNDRFLPNIYKNAVAVRQLRNGQPMLFLKKLEKKLPVSHLQHNADEYMKLRELLHERNLELALVIVPDKLTVYLDLLQNPPLVPGTNPQTLRLFQDLIQSRGIPVINLVDILKKHANHAVEHAETIYWSDDTHWNPKGIQYAAEAICEGLQLHNRCKTSN